MERNIRFKQKICVNKQNQRILIIKNGNKRVDATDDETLSLLQKINPNTKKNIDKIIEYRDKKGRINSRSEVEKLLSDKVYEQAIGFLRIPDGTNPFDITGIHPESYNVAESLLKELKLDIKDINKQEFKDELDNADIEKLSVKLSTDKYTLEDIVKELKNPGLDPRDELEAPILKSDVLHLEDLRVGMELQGTVRNVASFGAFVDIGLHDDGLIHISKMSKSFVKNPNDILNVGDIIKCYVDAIDLEKQKVQLSLIKQD